MLCWIWSKQFISHQNRKAQTAGCSWLSDWYTSWFKFKHQNYWRLTQQCQIRMLPPHAHLLHSRVAISLLPRKYVISVWTDLSSIWHAWFVLFIFPESKVSCKMWLSVLIITFPRATQLLTGNISYGSGVMLSFYRMFQGPWSFLILFHQKSSSAVSVQPIRFQHHRPVI